MRWLFERADLAQMLQGARPGRGLLTCPTLCLKNQQPLAVVSPCFPHKVTFPVQPALSALTKCSKAVSVFRSFVLSVF